MKQKYNLGQPMAWSMFEAEFDNYVLELNAALGGKE